MASNDRDAEVIDEQLSLQPGAMMVKEPEPLTFLPFADKERLQAQLTAFSETRQLFLDWIMGALVAGVDWISIHRKIGGKNGTDCPNKGISDNTICPKCGGKATLAKPGSEKICGMLQLVPRFVRDQDTIDALGMEGVIAYRCDLTDGAGRVVAEGRGARSVGQDNGDANKAIKMAAKSAQIDATLRVGGLSEVFTQDLEDMDPTRPREDDNGNTFKLAPPRRASSAPPAPVQADTSARTSAPPPEDAISSAKHAVVWARIHASLKARGNDTKETVNAVSAELDRMVEEGTNGARKTWRHVSWKRDAPYNFPALLDVIEATVARMFGF